jgi:hypothetical protein
MEATQAKKNIKNAIITDFLALVFIYFVPALSHMLKFPLYYADPMRIALFSILVLTKKENVYIMALSIPLISFLISGHPVFPKFLIVSLELFANVFLIFRFSNVIKNKFLLVFLSLFLSKSLYYLLKFVLIKFAVLDMGLISTPLYIQAILTLVFSTILAFILKRRKLSDQSE